MSTNLDRREEGHGSCSPGNAPDGRRVCSIGRRSTVGGVDLDLEPLGPGRTGSRRDAERCNVLCRFGRSPGEDIAGCRETPEGLARDPVTIDEELRVRAPCRQAGFDRR